MTIDQGPPSPRAAPRQIFAVFLALTILLAAAGSWFGLEALNDRHLTLRDGARTQQELTTRNEQLDRLAREADELLAQRRWPEAKEVSAAIEALDPGSPFALDARRRLAAGMEIENSEFIAYWLGAADAALLASDWEAAQAAMAQVSGRAPAELGLAALETRLVQGRKLQALNDLMQRAGAALQERRWPDAQALARQVLASNPQHLAAAELLKEAQAGEARELAARQQAVEIFARALALDTGVFNQEALDLLRQATRLDPQNPKIAAQFEKMAAYIRTVRVPDDFPSIAAALAEAKAGDRLVIGPGIWKESLLLPVRVDIQGAGAEQTIIQCAAEAGSVLTIGEGGSGSTVFGITFRHELFDPAAERFAVVLVNAGKVAFRSCRFEQGSGHGLAVIAGAAAEVRGCWFSGNAWDGVSVYGAGSDLQMRDSFAEENFSHGVDIWDGASGLVEGSALRGNGANGLLVHTQGKVVLRRNSCSENREFGIVLGAAGAGEAVENVLTKNVLGGMVTRVGAAALSVVANESSRNLGPGMVFERGLALPAGNVSHGNFGGDLLGDAQLPEAKEIVEEAPVPAAAAAPADGLPAGMEPAPPRAVVVEEP